MRHHLQEALTVETTTMMTTVPHEVDMVEDEKLTQTAKVTYIQVAMNVVVDNCFHLLLGNTLSMGGDKKEGTHLWTGCIGHLVNHTVLVQALGDTMEIVEKADMKVEAGAKSYVPNIISKKKKMLILCFLNVRIKCIELGYKGDIKFYCLPKYWNSLVWGKVKYYLTFCQ